MKPTCRLCHAAHWLNEPHVFAINKDAAAVCGDASPVEAPINASINRTANGRTREAYNAYMREYMRKRRAVGT